MAESIYEIAGSIGGHTRAARTSDWAAAMAPAWRGQMDRYERMVDPEGVLPDGQRRRQAESMRRAEMKRIALEGWRKRRADAKAAAK